MYTASGSLVLPAENKQKTRDEVLAMACVYQNRTDKHCSASIEWPVTECFIGRERKSALNYDFVRC